ncbi:MAG: TolC family protein [Pseudomonadota bacterium]
MNRIIAATLIGCAALAPLAAGAEPLSLDQAIERALHADPRVKEREHLVEAARALLQEAQGSDDLILSANTFLGLAPRTEGGFYRGGNESCDPPATSCTPRGDNYEVFPVTIWSSLQFSLIKPLYTFGKIENYSEAASNNIAVKQGDVALQRGKTTLDVAKSYYGYLAARETRKLMDDVLGRVDAATGLVREWLDDGGRNDVKQSDLYALEAARGLVVGYAAKAEGLEKIAHDGLRVLTDWPAETPLELADSRIAPLAPPAAELTALQVQALKQRPEMAQVEAGLKARQALVQASEADARPNVYAGIVGSVAYTPGRDQLDNPHVYDPFNHEGATPVIGLKWDYSLGVKPARVAKAQAELDATVQLAALARKGIPFEVAESYHQVQSYHAMVGQLEASSRAARRWMIASYVDFEAGLEDAEKILTALQAYVLAYSEYLQAVFEYNMQVMKLSVVTGER